MLSLLKKAEQTLLTGENIKDILFNKVNIVPYHTLSSVFHIDDLFKNDKGESVNAIVVLYEQKLNSGHYCALLKRGDSYEFFDPYGTKQIDDELEFSTFNRGFIGGQSNNLLNILKRDRKKFNVSHYKFQKEGDNINTCGRWCATRIRLGSLSIQQFADIFLKNPILDPDLLVVALTILDTNF